VGLTIVEAFNDMPAELAVAVLLHLPPDRTIEVLDQAGLEREPELITLMPRTAAAKLLAGVSADRLADIFRQVKESRCSELLDLLDPDTGSTSAACWNIPSTPPDRS
jgi:magnesium transporter